MEKEIRNEIVWVNALERKPDHCAPCMVVYIDVSAATQKPVIMQNFAFYTDGRFLIQGSNRSLEHYPVLYWADIPNGPQVSEQDMCEIIDKFRKDKKQRSRQTSKR